MATKKQKREAAEAKRAKFEEEHRQSGLRALKAEQERRRQTEAAYKEQALQVKQTLARGLLNNGHTLSEVDELLGESIAGDVLHLAAEEIDKRKSEAIAAGNKKNNQKRGGVRPTLSIMDEELRRQDEELIRQDIEEQFEPDFSDVIG